MRVPSAARHGAFLSYARRDGEAIAHALRDRLATDTPDIPVWIDRLELEGGIGWWRQIEEQLDRAEFLILIMTPAALSSDNTRREWRSARQRGVCVYPIKGAPDEALDYSILPRWMRKAHFYDPEREWQKLLAHLRRGCQSARVPFMAPPLPGGYVERPRETEALVSLLLAGESQGPVAITTALRGAGGFGKTTLATAICHDERVVESFDDGILWVTLGQTPNLLNEVTKLYAALSGERPGFVDLDDATRELALLLESKNCLLVIDDAWKATHVAPFLRGGTGCVRLLTTRLFEVAAEASRVDVDEMKPAEATALLLARAGVEPSDPEPFNRLAARLGGWPLPIKLVGSAIRQRIARGDSDARALEYVSKALDKKGITAFDKADTSDRADAVTLTVGASLDLLGDGEQQRCMELSIFPEDVAIPLSAVNALWGLEEFDTEDLVRRLDDLSLLEFDLRLGTLRMHDVLRSFLGTRLTNTQALHGRLVDAWGDAYALPDAYAWRRFVYHLQCAGRQDTGVSLLLDPRWLEARLQASDVSSLLADFEILNGNHQLDLVGDALRLSAPVIASDKGQLHTQLLGRLYPHHDSEIEAFRRRAFESVRRPALIPVTPALDAPGGMLQMTLVGHEGEINAVLLDADRAGLISASEDGTVRVWDRQGASVRVMEHRTLGARAVASSRNGAVAVSGGADGILYVWDLERGERIHAFWAERAPAFTGVALSASGRTAVSGSRDSIVRVWNIEARELVTPLAGHREGVTSVAITADGARAVSASEDCTLLVWNLTDGTKLRALEGHTGPVSAVALSDDGRWAVSGSSDTTVRLWDVEHGECVRTLRGHSSTVTSISLSEKAWRAISGSSDQTARVWDLETGQTIAVLEGHSDTVTTVSIDRAGLQAATGSSDRTVKMWRLDDLRPGIAQTGHAGAVTALIFSWDGKLCASGGSDGHVMVREAEGGRLLARAAVHSAPVRSLAFTDDGTCVLSSGIDGRYRWWSTPDDSNTWLPVRHTAPVGYCALSPRVRYLITSCGDRFVYVWEVPSGVLVERYATRQLFDHLITPASRRQTAPASEEDAERYLPGETVYDVVILRVSTDGDHVVLSATARLQEAPKKTRERGTAPPREVACLLVLQTATGRVQSITTGQAEPVSAFSVNPAGDRLAWAKSDHTIELWSLTEKRADRLTAFRGHQDKINAVGFSHHGRYLVSCARDRTARVWDVETGQQIAAYTADAALRSMALSPCDDQVAVGDVAGRVHILRVEEMSPQVEGVSVPVK
jgi:WD40 repeat protein